MSAENIHDVGPPEGSTHGTAEEFHLENISSTERSLTKNFPERSPEEKLALLRDFLRRKYAL
jgi:hypothetical protein